MSERDGPGWRFLPTAAGAEADLEAALREGPAAFGRALREGRARIGASRMAARLRALPSGPDPALRLLLSAPVQPQAIVDALTVAFAIVGLYVAVEPVEGFTSLGRRLEAGGETDLILLVDPSLAAEPDARLTGLAGDLASRFVVPAALARFGSAVSETPLTPGVDLLGVDVPPGAALDRRFATSFGTILRPAAADALADAAAAWAARRRGRAPKLVVTDLDGTLWTGILGERPSSESGVVSGVVSGAGAGAGAGIVPPLNGAYAGALKALSTRGFVLAVASRNEPADIEAAFAAAAFGPLTRGDFAAVAVGWEDKAALVARVLDEVGLGAEHAVFVDDDPVNCAKVAARFPAMDVRLLSGDPDAFAKILIRDPLLVGGGAEASLRAERYRARADVERLRTATPDVASFLAALDTRLTLQPLDAPNIARAAELASRVNQFLLRDMRPNVVELSRRDSPFDTLVRLDDAFGSHGIVGLMLARVEGDALVLDNLYLSCRALERGVENAMMAALAERAYAFGLARIRGRLEILPRNAPARAFISRVARLAADGSFDYSPVEAGPPGNVGPDIQWQNARDEAP